MGRGLPGFDEVPEFGPGQDATGQHTPDDALLIDENRASRATRSGRRFAGNQSGVQEAMATAKSHRIIHVLKI